MASEDQAIFKVKYGTKVETVTMPSSNSIGQLREAILQRVALTPETARLIFKGKQIRLNNPEEADKTVAMLHGSTVILLGLVQGREVVADLVTRQEDEYRRWRLEETRRAEIDLRANMDWSMTVIQETKAARGWDAYYYLLGPERAARGKCFNVYADFDGSEEGLASRLIGLGNMPVNNCDHLAMGENDRDYCRLGCRECVDKWLIAWKVFSVAFLGECQQLCLAQYASNGREIHMQDHREYEAEKQVLIDNWKGRVDLSLLKHELEVLQAIIYLDYEEGQEIFAYNPFDVEQEYLSLKEAIGFMEHQYPFKNSKDDPDRARGDLSGQFRAA